MGSDVVGTGVGPMLPTGTVTFFLTDIEASSSGWEAHPERMGPAVGRHYEILDSVAARWSGVRPVEQGEGDSVVVVFSRASDAVHAALEAQCELLGELGDTFGVRIALHTGEAQLRDEGNYFGPSVIRCARLRSCAHGGQILLSNACADVVAELLPDDASLLDLGEHRLKDLQRPERVFELCHPSLPRSGRFPPLRSQDASAHNLPAAMTPLIGREIELPELVELVMAERLVTLTGTGGCGKTRLALEVAGRFVDRFEGGVWWCELATRSEDDAAATLLAALLGESEATGPELLDAVGARLRVSGATLVVLDNAEHMLEAVATATAQLLGLAPDLHLLVTSREPLSVHGEVAWRVPSLGLPPSSEASPLVEQLEDFAAVRLFVERAARARSGFILSKENADSIVSICRRLDGIPLAIELAAARVRTMSPQRIAAELDDRFRLLTGGARTLLPRQQTLLASVAWSEALLDDTERAALRRLGVFVGGFTLEAAEYVLGSFDDVETGQLFDVVGHLVDKSLVTLDDSGRYRLLETIRSYSLTRLVETGEANLGRDAHAAWARWFTAEHDASYEYATARGEWFDVIDAEWPNLATAMEWLRDRPDELLQLVASIGHFLLTGQRVTDALKYSYQSILRFEGDRPASWYRAVASSRGILGNAEIELAQLAAQARELAVAAGDEVAVVQLDLSLIVARMRTRLRDEELEDARAVASRAAALGDSSTEINARYVPWQMLIASGRMSEVDIDLPAPIQHSRELVFRALGAMNVGELALAAKLLREADGMPMAARQESMFVASTAELLATLSGGRHTFDVPEPARDEALYQGIWRDAFAIYELRRAMRRGDWDHARRSASAEREVVNPRNTARIDALLVPSLVAADQREDAHRRAEALVRRAAAIDAPAQEIEGRLVLAELDSDETQALEALALARRHNLVLAQIDALEMLAILTSSGERAAQLKASTAAEREKRDYLFRWPTRAVLLDALATDDAEPVELERMVDLALSEH